MKCGKGGTGGKFLPKGCRRKLGGSHYDISIGIEHLIANTMVRVVLAVIHYWLRAWTLVPTFRALIAGYAAFASVYVVLYMRHQQVRLPKCNCE